MLDRLSVPQRYILQEFLFRNSEEAGNKSTPVAFDPIQYGLYKSSPDFDEDYDPRDWVAAHRCQLCGGVLGSDDNGDLVICTHNDCQSIRDYYGLIFIRYLHRGDSWVNVEKQKNNRKALRRSDASKVFSVALQRKTRFYEITFEQLVEHKKYSEKTEQLKDVKKDLLAFAEEIKQSLKEKR